MVKIQKIVREENAVMLRRKEVLNELKDIERSNKILNAEGVIARATDPNNPLHRYFEWDDSEAAMKWRLQQAHALILSFKVVIKEKQVNAFMNVKVQINKEEVRGYFSAERVLSDAELHQQVLEQAVRDLEYWKLKYDNLIELRPVLDEKKLAGIRRKLLK